MKKREEKTLRGSNSHLSFFGKALQWMQMSLFLVIYDVITVNLAYFLALWLRFDLQFSAIPMEFLQAYLYFAPIHTVFTVAVLAAFRLYNSLWRYASVNELNRILGAWCLSTVFHVVGISVMVPNLPAEEAIIRMPFSYYLMGPVIQLCFTVAARFGFRLVNMERRRIKKSNQKQTNVMIIGAGSSGQVILRELRQSEELDKRPCCVIDDDPHKWGRLIEGVPIVGGRDSILESAEKYHIDQILFAIPTCTPEQKRDILNICKETGCELKSLPGIYQLANGEVTLSSMKAVAVEDLLGREPIKVNMEEIFHQIQGKTILVTGGGGSIGSELCRQIAAHAPEKLVIFDIYENNAYDIEQELRRKYGKSLNLVVLIGSVRDSRRINMVMQQHRPDIVYHAAAHKHVPLMEGSPCEAIKNNVVGTYKTAYAAIKYGVQRFVLISTDKAVNPTNIMGASKRLCEMVIQTMDAVSRLGRMDLLPILNDHTEPEALASKHEPLGAEELTIESVKNKNRTGTQFVAVRFGNVLGSNGSVIPLFKKQIEAGGPVTVTHPDIFRYFMTIPEAVSLVLQAGTYAWGGEVFVLDMGEQVKIDTLARNLIKLSGFTPDVDIKIEYSGLRAGEKLYEERLMAEEGIKPTDNEKIHIGKPIPFQVDTFLKQLEALARASYENSEDIVEMVEQVVPTFHPTGSRPKAGV